MDITAIALQSGSSGNCIYVEASGVRLLFDAGINGRQAEARLAAYGRDIREVDALIQILESNTDRLACEKAALALGKIRDSRAVEPVNYLHQRWRLVM